MMATMETQDLHLLFGRRKDGYHYRRGGFALGKAALPVRATEDAFAPIVAIRKAPHRESEIAYRHFDGALWEPWYHSGPNKPGTLEEIKHLSAELLWKHCTDARESAVVEAFGTTRDAERAWKRGADFSDEPAVRRIAWKVRDLLFVDGRLHKRTMGPRFVVGRHRGDDDTENKVSIADAPYYQQRPALSAITFPAHRAGRMWELVEDLNLTSDADRSLLEGTYLILDREALDSIDHGPANLRATVNEAVNGLELHTLRGASRTIVTAIVLLRESVAKADEQRAFGGVLPEDVDGMRDALRYVDAKGLVDEMHPRLKATVRMGLRLFGLDPRASADDEALMDLVL